LLLEISDVKHWFTAMFIAENVAERNGRTKYGS